MLQVKNTRKNGVNITAKNGILQLSLRLPCSIHLPADLHLTRKEVADKVKHCDLGMPEEESMCCGVLINPLEAHYLILQRELLLRLLPMTRFLSHILMQR